jgi:hypothetical protein
LGIELREAQERLQAAVKKQTKSIADLLARTCRVCRTGADSVGKCVTCRRQVFEPLAPASEPELRLDDDQAAKQAAFWARRNARLERERLETEAASRDSGSPNRSGSISVNEALERLKKQSRADTVRQFINRDGFLIP